jgi:magnesium transporter
MNESHDVAQAGKPWQTLSECLDRSDKAEIHRTLQSLGSGEAARAILQLSAADQQRLLALLSPEDAAGVVREVGDELAADAMEDLTPGTAAAIVDELPSDKQADLLGEMNKEAAQAVLECMAPEEASEARKLLAYEPETAGGVMITETLAHRQTERVRDVLEDLSRNRDKYVEYDVQYIYVTDDDGRLTGVMRSRDLLFAPADKSLAEVMLPRPLSVRTDTPLERLEALFDEHKLLGLPVTDAAGRLVGVVLLQDVEEAAGKRSNRQFLRISGIIAGEEVRSMPLLVRSGRRLSWLSINILLNIVAASVIALYQDTIQAAVALAVFLPIISDMSGCSGNQAVAVSIRELTLGVIRPREVFRVLFKEVWVGLIAGLALGVLLAVVAVLWKSNGYLGLVVGGALAVNTLLSVCLGGVLPLVLKRFKVDPALLSGPILTTVTDTCGFFLVLSIASQILPHLQT